MQLERPAVFAALNPGECRVGDGVAGAREQVGEADLRTHACRQHAQRQENECDVALSKSFNAFGIFRQNEQDFQNLICADGSRFKFC
jgi:hypothetical protein